MKVLSRKLSTGKMQITKLENNKCRIMDIIVEEVSKGICSSNAPNPKTGKEKY